MLISTHRLQAMITRRSGQLSHFLNPYRDLRPGTSTQPWVPPGLCRLRHQNHPKLAFRRQEVPNPDLINQ